MRIRDPVHGDILLPDFARDLLDTLAMQRLRGVRQLGFAHLVYPGCVHTRFDHSLGTAHTAQRLFAAAVPDGEGQEFHALIASALLHDIAHIPFGHTLEDEFALFPRHDTVERLACYLEDSEIKSVLRREGLFPHVRDILLRQLPQHKRYLSDIISSTVDADVLDYLRRDAYFAGLVQDYDDRVFANFAVSDGRLVYRLSSKGLIRQDARSELLHLLRLRYYLTERVSFHHTKIAAGAMLAKLVSALSLTLTDLQGCGDDILLHNLRQMAQAAGNVEALRLCERITSRKLYKRSFVASGKERFTSYWRDRRVTEWELARLAGVSAYDVCVYLGPLASFKEADISVVTNAGVTPLRLAPERDTSFLFDEYERLCRFYVFAPAEHAEAVKWAAENYLGMPSEFSRGGVKRANSS